MEVAVEEKSKNEQVYKNINKHLPKFKVELKGAGNWRQG